MSSRGTPNFRPNGRLRGYYVYMLLCQDGSTIHAKIGRAHDPIKRARALIVGCPIEPGVLAVCELPSRSTAQRAEAALHHLLKDWRTRGEWFRFEPADKETFNHIWRTALGHFASPSWPIRWTKLSMPALQRYGNSTSSYRRMVKRRR